MLCYELQNRSYTRWFHDYEFFSESKINGTHGNQTPASARCMIAVVRIGTFSFGGLVVGQFITDQDEQ